MPAKPKCKHCRAPATLKIQMANYCSVDCAYKRARQLQDKNRVENERKAKQEHRQRKESLKTQRQWAAEVQQVFNKMRRLEELVYFKQQGVEPWCISCQKPLGGDEWSCGHYKTRGARPDIAMLRLNTHLQHNHGCNKHKSGDVDGQKIGFELRYGKDEADRILDGLEIVRPMIKRSAQEWIELKKEFNAEIRRLQKLFEN